MTRKAYLPGPGRMTQALVLMRRITGRSQEAVAERMGMSRGVLAHRETGVSAFTVEEADLYLKALGCKLAIVPIDSPPGFDLLAERLATPDPHELIVDHAPEGTHP